MEEREPHKTSSNADSMRIPSIEKIGTLIARREELSPMCP
jgi:hypothetical protein